LLVAHFDFQAPLPDGVLAVDKPRGMTSHDVVGRLRRLTGTRRIGHTGTLDPLATGLLLICLGPATRIAQFLTGLDKVYTGTMTLGAISATYDAEGDITAQERPLPGEAELRGAMAAQLGERMQLPPPYSAIKVAGKKLYEYARAGEAAPAKPRLVRIARFDLLRYDAPRAEFSARVGSGTYIRSMAHDVGLALGCGGYLSALRRTRVGAFDVEDAVTLEALEQEPALVAARLMGLTEALGHMPKITLQPAAERVVLHGGSFETRDILEFEGVLRAGQPLLVLDEQGRALSIAQGETRRAGEDEEAGDAGGVAREAGEGAAEDGTQDAAEAGGELDFLHGPALVFRPLRVLA
jgi:tRNA pseudouridine55 synthase